MASVFSLLESEQHGAEGLWPTALGEHCPVDVMGEHCPVAVLHEARNL